MPRCRICACIQIAVAGLLVVPRTGLSQPPQPIVPVQGKPESRDYLPQLRNEARLFKEPLFVDLSTPEHGAQVLHLKVWLVLVPSRTLPAAGGGPPRRTPPFLYGGGVEVEPRTPASPPPDLVIDHPSQIERLGRNYYRLKVGEVSFKVTVHTPPTKEPAEEPKP